MYSKKTVPYHEGYEGEGTFDKDVAEIQERAQKMEGKRLAKTGGKKGVIGLSEDEFAKQEKLWQTAITSIDEARRAEAPDYPSSAKVSGANLAKINNIGMMLDGILRIVNERDVDEPDLHHDFLRKGGRVFNAETMQLEDAPEGWIENYNGPRKRPESEQYSAKRKSEYDNLEEPGVHLAYGVRMYRDEYRGVGSALMTQANTLLKMDADKKEVVRKI